jgi:hypothetical protein
MAKTLTAKNIANIGEVRFSVDKNGNLTKLEVTCEVNYGIMGMTETLDILPHLTSPDEIGKAKALYKAIKRELERIYLG